MSEVARNLGINANTLSRWKRGLQKQIWLRKKNKTRH
ncbi:hypothetical protein DRQ36_06285 [bacterium]|nr:MAG: hypothetical protein DRQ36_06285 [bacterium]